MTHELECRWQDGETPFDGVTLCGRENLNTNELSKILRCIVKILQGKFGSRPLRFFDCWFEHDGILSITKPSSWEALASEVKNEESLNDAFSWWDHGVFRSYLTIDQNFLLRYYSSNSYLYPGDTWHEFDLTSIQELVLEIESELKNQNIFQIETTSSKEYFRDRGAHASDMSFYQKELKSYRKGECKIPYDYPPQMWRC